MSDIFDRLEAARIVPVLTARDADEAERATYALLEGGLSVVEVTFRTDAAADAIRRLAGIDGVLVGAGTVLSPEQLGRAIDAGASFAVAPGTSDIVVTAAEEGRLPFIPGVATPSEIERALSLGCRVLKLFPASIVGGPAFVKSVTPVYRDVRFVPTGGVNVANLGSYLELSSVLACCGTWICEQSLLSEDRFDEVERRAREAVEVASAYATAA